MLTSHLTQCCCSLSLLAFFLIVFANADATFKAPGIMQVQVEGFFNPHGRDSSGRCCVPPPDDAKNATACDGDCRTFFRVCAAKVGPNWPDETDLRQHTLACPLGLLVTPTIANNSLEPRRDGLLLMRFPYREWPGKVKLVIEAWHDVTGELFGRDPYENPEEKIAKLIVRVERRHKLVSGEDWLRRSVRVNLPNRSPLRKVNRRITFTYALRLAPLPDPAPTTTTSTTTTSTTTTTTELPERESTDQVNNQVVTSSNSFGYTPLPNFTQRPHTQYTPIDGAFLPQTSNAYPLPQSQFTQSTTTTTTTETPEKEFTLLENVYSPGQFSTTTPTSPWHAESSAEDKFTPVATVPRPEEVLLNYPLPQPPYSTGSKPVKIPSVNFNELGGLVLPPGLLALSGQTHPPTPAAGGFTHMAGVHVSHSPGSIKPNPTPSSYQPSIFDEVHVSHSAGSIKPNPSTPSPYQPPIFAGVHLSHTPAGPLKPKPTPAAPYQPPIFAGVHVSHSSSFIQHKPTPSPYQPPLFAGVHVPHPPAGPLKPKPTPAAPYHPPIFSPISTTTEEPEIEYTPLGAIHVVVSTTEQPDASVEESQNAPIHNIFASFNDYKTKGQFPPPTSAAAAGPKLHPFSSPDADLAANEDDDFMIPYSYPTTVQSTEKEYQTTPPSVLGDESDEVLVSAINSAIVEKNENGTESSAFSTMPVHVVDTFESSTLFNPPAPRTNASASVILDKLDASSEEESAEDDDNEEEPNKTMEELYEYAVYPNADDDVFKN